MGKAFIRQMEHLIKGKKSGHRRRRICAVLAVMVALGTAYVLMLPAATWEGGLVCGTEEHTHTQACYEELPPSLVCQLAEHTHADGCYEDVTSYICGMDDDVNHSHTEECQQTERVLTCGTAEHTHDETCYDTATTQQLICTLEEHTHSEACRETAAPDDAVEYAEDEDNDMPAAAALEESRIPEEDAEVAAPAEQETVSESETAEKLESVAEPVPEVAKEPATPEKVKKEAKAEDKAVAEEAPAVDAWTRSPLGWVGKTRAFYTADTGALSGAKRGSVENIPSVIPGADEYITGAYASDPATSDIEDAFFAAARDGQLPSVNDGKLLADKSVVYMGDDYGAFDAYGEGTFGVTLSVLGQDYQMKEMDHVKIPVDVVFVLDVSGSMGNAAGSVTRREAVVNAVNTAMSQIMDDNPENRAGVVLYSSGGSTLLSLDHYTAGRNGQYLNYNNEKIRTAYSLRGRQSGGITQTYGEVNGFTQSHGTYTQYGIALGARLLQNNSDTTYTAALHPHTDEERQVTVTRQPVIILLSDGDPTHCTSNYTDVLSGPAYGDGIYPSTTNNKGIQGYYTILSANYYKDVVGNHYDTPAMFYTIGMGINATGYRDMSGASSTGDCYKRAVLNPTAANVEDLISSDARTTNPNSKYTAGETWSISCRMLNQLLGNRYGRSTVTVGSTSSYRQAIGTTSAAVPVIDNPYAGQDSYADGAYFGNLSTSDLQEIFDRIISGNLNIKRFGYLLSENTRVAVKDEIGEGMELKGTPMLRYNGAYYPLEQTGSGDRITYVCHATAVTSDGSQRTADLSKIRITVTTEDGKQTVTMELPDTVIPTYTPSFTEDWYYEELPVRLIYQVGLTDAAKADIKALQPEETLTYYTNAWGDISAEATHKPHQDNPYYHDVTYEDGTSREKQYRDYAVSKTDNATDTAAASALSEEEAAVIYVKLGNNGKLTFHSTAPTVFPLKLRKTDMLGNTVTDCSAEFILYADKALTEELGTYKTENGVVTIPDLQINTTYYLKEIRAPEGYYPMPEAKAFSLDAKGNVTGIEGDLYMAWTAGELLVRNPNGYRLPETGGIGTGSYVCGGLLLMAIPVAAGCRMRRKRERGNR